MKETRIKTRITFLLLTAILTLNGVLIAQENDSKLLPSEALTLMINAVDMQPGKKRIDATKPYMPRVITTGLSKEEQFYLGEIYFWNFMPKEAYDAYDDFLDGDDDFARAAWQRTMQINFRAFEKFDIVEKDLVNFRKKFDPIPSDKKYTNGQVYNVASRYVEEGNHEKVLQLINEELNVLDYEGTYNSFKLPAFFARSYIALDKANVAVESLENAIAGLQKTLEKRRNSIPENDPDFPVNSSRVNYMHTVVTDKLSYAQMNERFIQLIDELKSYVERFKKNN